MAVGYLNSHLILPCITVNRGGDPFSEISAVGDLTRNYRFVAGVQLERENLGDVIVIQSAEQMVRGEKSCLYMLIAG